MKVVKTALIVVGMAAAIIGTAGLLAPVAVGAALGSIGLSLAAVSAIGLAAGIAGQILTMTSKPPKGLVNGTNTTWQADTQAGLPIIVGRTYNAGNIVKRETYGADHVWQAFATVYSLGPIAAIEQFFADRVAINFDAGGNAIGSYSNWMYFRSQIGLSPTPVGMSGTVAGLTMPGWSAARKGSGLAASLWFLLFDKKDGKKYGGGQVPSPGVVARGIMCYDPRKDDTKPGGIGAHRPNVPSTYEYSERPALVAVTWALGIMQNGIRRAGCGFDPTSIDLKEVAAWANVCDANDWKVGGVLNTLDDKWNALKAICQAGSCNPVQLGGRLSFDYNAPRVSIATITEADLLDRAGVVGSQPIRNRINTIVPRIRSEAHGWEVVPLNEVAVPEYVTLDGRRKSRELDLQLVQWTTQAAQLCGYEISNGRELTPIELALKINWVGIRPGLAVTINIPSLNVNNQKAICNNRSFNPADAAVQLQFTTETDSKHDYALGRTTVAPIVPTLTAASLDFSAPAIDEWHASALALSAPGAGGSPAIRFAGLTTRATAASILFEYRRQGDTDWQSRSAPRDTTLADVTGLYPATIYETAVRYLVNGIPTDRRLLETVTTSSVNTAPVAWPDVTNPTGGKPTDYADKTGDNIANGFVNSGGLAYKNTINYDQTDIPALPLAIRPANLSNGAYLRSIYSIYEDGNTVQFYKPQEVGANVTENRIANGFVNSGGLAYKNSVTYGTGDTVGFGGLAGKESIDLKLIGTAGLASLVGNTISRISGGDSYDPIAVGVGLSGVGAFAECDIAASAFTMVSLDDDDFSIGYATMNYMLQYYRVTGAWYLYENGVNTLTGNAGASATGRIGLYYNGSQIKLVIAGSTAIKPAVSNLKLFAKFTAYTAGSIINNMTYGAWTEGARLGSNGNFLLEDGITLGTDITIHTPSGVAGALYNSGSLAYKNTIDPDADMIDGATYLRFPKVVKDKVDTVATNADVTAAQQVVVTPPNPQIVYRDYQGVVKDASSRYLNSTVSKGGVSIRIDNSVSYSITTTGALTGVTTIDNVNGSASKGRITITGGGGAGTIALTVTVSGVSYGPFSIPFATQDDPPPTTSGGTGGAGAGSYPKQRSDSSFPQLLTASFVQMTATNSGEALQLVTVASGETIRCSAPLTYNSGYDQGDVRMVCYWGYRIAGSGSAFTAFSSNIQGSAASATFDGGTLEGEIYVTQNKASLAAGDYEVELFGACDASSKTLSVLSGTANIAVGI